MNEQIDEYINKLPIDENNKRRIKMILDCSDLDSLPRVPDAGMVFDGPEGRYQMMHNGIKVIEHGYIGHWVTELIKLLKGFHEPQEEKAFSEILQYIPQNATMIELGSWWAYYSLWFKKQIPNSTSYMIEPDINNLEVGEKNFFLNGMQGHFINAAVGKESLDDIPYQCYESDGVVRHIPFVSIDDFIQRESINFVDLLLVDIQGFELQMLEGAEKSIKKGQVRFVVISTHHHLISNDPLTHQKCLKFLEGFGAHVIAEHGIYESFSGDGLIVASLRHEDRHLPVIELSRNRASGNLFREMEYDLEDALSNQKMVSVRLEDALEDGRQTHVILDQIRKDRDLLQENLNTITAERDKITANEKKLTVEYERVNQFLSEAKEDKLYLQSLVNEVQFSRDRIQKQLDDVWADREQLQKKYDEVWMSRHHYWAELNDLYHSRSWRITAPIRKITPWLRFWRDRVIRISQRPFSYFAAKLLSRSLNLFKYIPFGNWLLMWIRSKFPNFYLKWSLWTNRAIQTVTIMPISVHFSPSDEITSTHENHYLALFQRELQRRKKNTEVK